jgi:hypothetical protein
MIILNRASGGLVFLFDWGSFLKSFGEILVFKVAFFPSPKEAERSKMPSSW